MIPRHNRNKHLEANIKIIKIYKGKKNEVNNVINDTELTISM